MLGLALGEWLERAARRARTAPLGGGGGGGSWREAMV